MAEHLAKTNPLGFFLCVREWLLRTYVPIHGYIDLPEDCAKIEGLAIQVYRNRFASGVDDYRPVFVIFAKSPRTVTERLVLRFREYVTVNQGVVGFIFCQRPVPPKILKMSEEDHSVLVVSDRAVAQIMVDKGVGVRLSPFWSNEGPHWELDEEFLKRT